MNEMEINESEYNLIAKREYETTIDEIKKDGVIKACVNYRARLDSGIIEAAKATKDSVACSEGCWYCCYYKVDLRPEEAFIIVNYVRERFSQEKLSNLRKVIQANAKTMKSLNHQEQLAANMKCPFLENNCCSIYPVRPEKCRTFHAKDVEGCLKSYEEPTNLEIPNSFVVEIFTSNEAHSEGHNVALAETGFDAAPYELNSALSLAMVDSKYRKRYEKKKSAFPSVGRSE